MKTSPVIIEFLGNPLRFFTVNGKSACKTCAPDEATIFKNPADARAKAIIHRFSLENYCMVPAGRTHERCGSDTPDQRP